MKEAPAAGTPSTISEIRSWIRELFTLGVLVVAAFIGMEYQRVSGELQVAREARAALSERVSMIERNGVSDGDLQRLEDRLTAQIMLLREDIRESRGGQ